MKIDNVTCVAKAYTTRVGLVLLLLKTRSFRSHAWNGREFRATTAERRCGWFDAVLVRHACRLNGASIGCHQR